MNQVTGQFTQNTSPMTTQEVPHLAGNEEQQSESVQEGIRDESRFKPQKLRQFRHPGEIFVPEISPLPNRGSEQILITSSLEDKMKEKEEPQNQRQTHSLPDEVAISPLPTVLPDPVAQRVRKRRSVPIRFALSALLLFVITGLFLSLLLAPTTLLPGARQGQASIAGVGHLLFTSSEQLDPISKQGLYDQVHIDLLNLKQSTGGTALCAWLLPERGATDVMPLLIGKLFPDTDGRVSLTYKAPDHRNLLAEFSRFLITEESATISPLTPTLDQRTWRFSGEISNVPTPGDEKGYSLLAHLRHLLAKDPNLEQIGLSGGLSIWLYRNSQKLLEWTGAARDEWGDAHVDLLRRQIIRVIQYLDGSAYAWRDLPQDVPWLVDPKAGRLGLLNVVQNQEVPGYLAHISLHLAGLTHSPGVTREQKDRAVKIDEAIHTMTMLMQQIRTDAIQLVQMNDDELRGQKALSLLNNLVTNANMAYAGQIEQRTGETKGGVMWVQSQMQQLAEIPILAL